MGHWFSFFFSLNQTFKDELVCASWYVCSVNKMQVALGELCNFCEWRDVIAWT